MEYWDMGTLKTFRIAIAMMAVALLLPLGFRMIQGPAPTLSCYERAPLAAATYLHQTKEIYVLAGAVLASAVLVLSIARRRLEGRAASPGPATLVAVGIAAAATGLFLVDSDIFMLYFLAAAALASWIALIVILVLAGRAASRARSLGSSDPWLRWCQMVGWYLLAVVLPVSFVFIAPWGPLCFD
jgi:hypothetical protein